MKANTHLFTWKLFTGADSREIDSRTIEFGVSGGALMEIAGSKTADLIVGLYPNLKSVTCYCGKGNNGGDALVIARHLASQNIAVDVVMLSPVSELSADSHANYALLKKLFDSNKYNISIFDTKNHELEKRDKSPQSKPFLFRESHEVVESFPKEKHLIIDGLLGTGLSSSVREPYFSAIETINNSGFPVLSLDIPSGLDANTGLAHGIAVKATQTCCMGNIKLGTVLGDGPAYCGSTYRIDLGFPSHLSTGPERYLLHEPTAISPRKSSAKRKHKYESGVVYVIGGSSGLSGAAIIAALAAWKTGVGAVIVITPGCVLPAVEANLPSQIKIGVGDSETTHFRGEHVDEILQLIRRRPGRVLIGPGLGINDDTKSFVNSFIDGYSDGVVLDADALKMLEFTSDSSMQHILTPHPGELESIINIKPSNDYHRLKLAEEFSKKSNHVVLAKGSPSFLCHPDENTWITGYDNSAFTRAGFGDVLAGKIAGYWSMEKSITSSCIFALWSGKLAIDKNIQEGNQFPEPLDII